MNALEGGTPVTGAAARGAGATLVSRDGHVDRVDGLGVERDDGCDGRGPLRSRSG